MVFPSFGVEIVRRVHAQVRNTALGGFAAFQDVAYGLPDPVTGLAAVALGYPSVFAVGVVSAMGALVIAIAMARGGLGWRPNREVGQTAAMTTPME